MTVDLQQLWVYETKHCSSPQLFNEANTNAEMLQDTEEREGASTKKKQYINNITSNYKLKLL